MATSDTRSAAGRALMADITNDIRQDLYLSEKQYGIDAIKNLPLRWILACLYYASHENKKAEYLWARYNFIIGGKPVSKAALVFWGLSKGVDASVYEQLTEAIFQHAKAHRKKDTSVDLQFAFVMALVALSCCTTTGLHRTPPGAEILTRLRFFLKPYLAPKIEWQWIVDHSDLCRNDFVGLLSVLLTQSRLVPRRKITTLMPRQYVRKAA